jgi:Zn-dependent protease
VIALLGGALIGVVMVAQLMVALLRLRLQVGTIHPIEPADCPPHIDELLAGIAPELAERGFTLDHVLVANSLEVLARPRQYQLWYRHASDPILVELHLWAASDVAMPWEVTFYTPLADGRFLATLNTRLPMVVGRPPDLLLDDAWSPTLAGQEAYHRQRMQLAGERVIGLEQLSGEAPASCQLRQRQNYLRHLLERGMARPLPDGTLGLRLATILRILWPTLWGMLRANNFRQKLPGGHQGQVLPLEVQVDQVINLREQLARPFASRGGSWILLLMSGLAFWGVGSFFWGGLYTLILLGVVLLHEYGHLGAMRWAGYTGTGVVLIPGLGGMALGTPGRAAAGKRLVVLFAGPLPGLLLASAGAVWLALQGFPLRPAVIDPAWLMVVVTLWVINLFNLLPFVPLDGGRIVEAALFARAPWLRLLFSLLGGAALLAIAWRLESRLLALLAGLSLLGAVHDFKQARLLRQANPLMAARDEDERVRAVLGLLNTPQHARLPQPRRLRLAVDLLGRLEQPRLKPLAAVVALAVLVLAWLLPLLVLQVGRLPP